MVAEQFMEFLKTKELHPISMLHGDEFLGLASLQAAVSIGLRSRTKAISEPVTWLSVDRTDSARKLVGWSLGRKGLPAAELNSSKLLVTLR
jgi:hypothetical protein